MRPRLERRALQALVLVGATLPVTAGGAGFVLGPAAFGAMGFDTGSLEIAAGSADLASHVAYLSGVLLGVGLGFWSCVPGIERRGARIRLLALIVVAGGIARLAALGLHGVPGLPHLLAFLMEFGVTPAIAVWQRRIARRAVS